MSEMELFATISFVTKDSTIDVDMGPGYVSNKKNSKESSKCLATIFLENPVEQKKTKPTKLIFNYSGARFV